MTTIFYITSSVLLIVIFAILLFMYGRARLMNDESLQLRRRSFIAFYILLAIHVCSSFDVITDKGIEVLATFPICTLCVTFTTFMMLSSAYFGRKHHLHFFLWFVLLQYPAIMLIIHILTRLSGRYVRIHSMEDLMTNRSGEMHIIFQGRLVFLAIVIVCFIFMICMLIDAYEYYVRQQRRMAVQESTKRKIMRRDEILDIAIYAGLLFSMMASFLIPSLWLHIINNILMTGMIGRTLYVYNNFLLYSETSTRKLAIFAYISKRISKLIEQERNNPIYQSNATLDDVADALQVDRQDFSDYLYEELNTNFSGWVSEQKIMHVTEQLVLTDRKINELAVVCGYNNATSLSRAFKAKYGVTPSEYRDENKV